MHDFLARPPSAEPLSRRPRHGSGPARPHQITALRERRRLQVSHRFQRAAAAIGALRPGHVLEVGCGHGILLSELHRQWPAMYLVGIDRSAPLLATARARNPQALALGRLHLMEADVFGMPPCLGFFDAIVTVNFNPLGFPETGVDRVQGLAQLLAPGGMWLDFHDSTSAGAIERHARHALDQLQQAGLETRVVGRSTQWLELHATRR